MTTGALALLTIVAACGGSSSSTGSSQAAAGNFSQALFSIVIAGSLLSIVPLSVAFLLLQRYVASGLAIGSVKN